jgi:UDP-N-acetylglucosamine 2-epimerase (non-hydrolysing)
MNGTMKKKIFLVFGTRPEAIKMAPVCKELSQSEYFDTKIVLTGQHREMLDQVMTFFGLKADFDLNVMKANQSLYELSSNVLLGLEKIFSKEKPDLILVHGDTTTTFIASLAAFYQKIPVGHVEAGLRTGDIYSPFPEEMNRKLTGNLCLYHFAPTNRSKENLIKENIDKSNILVTGNTVIDALHAGVEIIKNSRYQVHNILDRVKEKKVILVTGHRRENFGDGFLNICKALKEIAESNSDTHIIYPVHLNPNVMKPVYDLLGKTKNIELIEPLGYEEFLVLLNNCFMVITDSGGVQEEAPSLGKPVLVMRNTTERPEAVEAGTVKLVGTEVKKIVTLTTEILKKDKLYQEMSEAHNPYGDGKASKRIRTFLEERFV